MALPPTAPDARLRWTRTPMLERYAEEARTLELSPAVLATADLTRLRALAQDAAPTLDAWEWGLVSHHLPDETMTLVVERSDATPSAQVLAAELADWADDALPEEAARADRLAQRIAALPPPAMLALWMRVRAERVDAYRAEPQEVRERRLNAERVRRHRGKI